MKIQEVEVQNLEHLRSNMSDSKKAREELLKEFDLEQSRPKELSVNTLVKVYGIVILALLILLPKIYISNQIYYSSKDIDRLYNKYTALKEEHSFLKRELEKLHYQTKVVDSVN